MMIPSSVSNVGRSGRAKATQQWIVKVRACRRHGVNPVGYSPHLIGQAAPAGYSPTLQRVSGLVVYRGERSPAKRDLVRVVEFMNTLVTTLDFAEKAASRSLPVGVEDRL